MPHIDLCPRRKENRDGLTGIVFSAHNQDGRLTTIAEALQRRGRGEERQYYCPDDSCRVEMVPRAAAYNVPYRSESREGYYDRCAHFAALAEGIVQGPRRAVISRRQDAVNLIASHLRASGLYEVDKTSNPLVYSNAKVHQEIYRKEAGLTTPAGWGTVDYYDADLVAFRRNCAILIQVEESPVSQRYGNANRFVQRVRNLADTDSNKRRSLYADEKKIEVNFPKKIHQAADNLYVLDLDEELLLIPRVTSGIDAVGKYFVDVEWIDSLGLFGFIEKMYSRSDWKRYDPGVDNRSSRRRGPLITQLRVAKPVPIVYNQETGRPINQNSKGYFCLDL